ncbi:MAG: DegT/DnrJ/EryC1/StrS family aminotransferase [Gemmatimonadaceae bacterium]
MIPRGAPYISWTDLLAGSVYCVLPGSADALQRNIEALWAPNTVASLSVRSGLDALLHVFAFPRGSEIIVSAITIPHVVDILLEYGLVPVPVDIDLATLAIDADDVRSAITPRTKAILVAHVFGSRMPLDEIVAVAREHSLPLLEDCAQANDGSAWRGHADATVSMFSFGSIKRQTALGGGVLRFRDAALAGQVRQQQATYARQSRGSYLKRVGTMMVLKAVTARAMFNVFIGFCNVRGMDHDKTLGTALRAFSKGDLFVRLRQQPSVPLLRMLQRRLRQSLVESVAERVAIVDVVTSEFPELNRPGTEALRHSHWLFPMLTTEPEELMHQLWARGFDATCGASNLISVKAPAGCAVPVQAERLMDEVLYLPLYPSASPSEMRELARAVRELEHVPDRAHAALS